MTESLYFLPIEENTSMRAAKRISKTAWWWTKPGHNSITWSETVFRWWERLTWVWMASWCRITPDDENDIFQIFCKIACISVSPPWLPRCTRAQVSVMLSALLRASPRDITEVRVVTWLSGCRTSWLWNDPYEVLTTINVLNPPVDAVSSPQSRSSPTSVSGRGSRSAPCRQRGLNLTQCWIYKTRPGVD